MSSSFSRLVRPAVGEDLVVDHDGRAGQLARLDGALDRVPARSAEVRDFDPDDVRAVVLDLSAVCAGSMSATLSSDRPSRHAAPTMLMNTNTRVRDGSIIFFLHSSKVRQPRRRRRQSWSCRDQSGVVGKIEPV